MIRQHSLDEVVNVIHRFVENLRGFPALKELSKIGLRFDKIIVTRWWRVFGTQGSSTLQVAAGQVYNESKE